MPVRIPYREPMPKNGSKPIRIPVVEPNVMAVTDKQTLNQSSDRPAAENKKNKPVRIAYREPAKCTDGSSHNCSPVLDLTLPSNGNGKSKPTNPIPSSVARSVIQSRLNEDLITPEQIIKEAMKIATSDIADWPDCPRTLAEAPEHFRKAVSGLKIHLEKNNKGEPILDKDGNFVYGCDVTLWSKTAAIDQLNKWAGNYSKDNAQSKPDINVQNNIQVNQVNLKDFSKEELLTLYKLGVLKSQNEEILLLPENNLCD